MRRRNPSSLVLLGAGLAAAVGFFLLTAKRASAAPGGAITTNPDGSAHAQGTAFVFDSNADAAAAVAEANRRGITVAQLLQERGQS